MNQNSDAYDVVIVGSGAGGSAAAWTLASSGFRVLILEAGPSFDPARDYRLHRQDWETSRGFPIKPGSQGHYSFGQMQLLEPRWESLRSWNHKTGKMGEGKRREGWKYHHVRGAGGSTLHFTGEAQRLNPLAMKMRSQYGVAADWPLDYAELEPFYEIAERIIGVAGPADDAQRPRRTPCPLPPHELSYTSRRIKEQTQDLGVTWAPNTLAVLSRPYDKRPACNYCGGCNHGCPRTDKGSADITFLRKALATGRCTLKTGASVLALNAGADDKVASLDYADTSGRVRRQATPLLVLACGAVETPRLLLLSKSRFAPEGLANESGQVGRNFMESLFFISNGIHPEPLGSHRGLPADMNCWDYNRPNAIPNTVGGCRFSPVTAEAGLNGPLAYAQRVVKGWGLVHKQGMRETFGRVIGIGAMGESLPHPGSFIDLDAETVDDNGLPLARINGFLDAQELIRLAFMADKCRQILRACGVRQIVEEYGSYDMFSATHVFGSCRMGVDPESSVVDAECRSHRWHNLFITDASVFPSSGGGESPSLTIEALAVRAASRLMEKKA